MATYKSVFRKDLFKDEVVLVTGGGTGIGRCISHELASLGALVIIAARKMDQLQATAREIALLGGRSDCMALNIRDPIQCQSVVNDIVAKHGKLTGLVNNAGGQFLSPASMLSSKGFATVIDLNLQGTFNMCRAAFEGWMGDHGGKIVNIVADVRDGIPKCVHTAAARAGIINMTKTLAVEWGPYNNIRINCLAPGLIVSSGMKNYSEEIVETIASGHWMNPAGRFGTESEVAAGVTFLLSPAASFVSGINLAVDGGSSIARGYPEGQDLIFNPEGSMIAPYVGWPECEENVYGIKHVDAPPKITALLEKYKRVGHKGSKL